MHGFRGWRFGHGCEEERFAGFRGRDGAGDEIEDGAGFRLGRRRNGHGEDGLGGFQTDDGGSGSFDHEGADGMDGRGGELFGLFPPEEGLGLAQPAENKA